MPATERTGRNSQTREVPPVTLDCGHSYGPGLVIVGYGPAPDGGRARTYDCRACGHTTYSPYVALEPYSAHTLQHG